MDLDINPTQKPTHKQYNHQNDGTEERKMNGDHVYDDWAIKCMLLENYHWHHQTLERINSPRTNECVPDNNMTKL